VKIRPDSSFDCNYSQLYLTREFSINLVSDSLAQAPNANWRCFAASAAFTAKIQYFCDSMWNLGSSLKLISSKNWLSAGTSSRAIPARDSSSSMLCPVGSIKVAAGHGQVKVLYCVEMGQNIPFDEVEISNDILTLGYCLHMRRHCSKFCKWFVALH
jgi:hypothetical protein